MSIEASWLSSSCASASSFRSLLKRESDSSSSEPIAQHGETKKHRLLEPKPASQQGKAGPRASEKSLHCKSPRIWTGPRKHKHASIHAYIDACKQENRQAGNQACRKAGASKQAASEQANKNKQANRQESEQSSNAKVKQASNAAGKQAGKQKGKQCRQA